MTNQNKPAHGGTRPGSGQKKKDPAEKKETVSFQIKSKHVPAAKLEIQAILQKYNS